MYGKPDRVDRLVQVVLALVALFSLVMGVFMLADPFAWYDFIGTVKATGPANAHFIRDIGIAYLASGAMIGFAARNPTLRWGSALVGNIWLGAHGILHIYEVMAGICSPDIFWRDAPGVLGPPVAVLAAIAIQFGRQRVSAAPLPRKMFLGFMRKSLGKDAAYLDRIDEAGGYAMECFQHAMVLGPHHYHSSGEMAHMARLGATRAEDCGPCLEITSAFAQGDGMSRERIDAAVAGSPQNEEDALAFDFGAAIAAGDILKSAELGDAIEEHYGSAVRTELSLAAASNRLYPAIKRGLGLASACATPTRS